MAYLATGYPLDRRICEILGLRPERVKQIVIALAPGEVVVQVTTTYVEEGQLKELVRVFEGLVWRERDEDEEVG